MYSSICRETVYRECNYCPLLPKGQTSTPCISSWRHSVAKNSISPKVKKHTINARDRKKITKSMSRDQVIPLSRKARATRLRKELSRWAWPYFAPVVLKQALCCENCSKPLYFLPYLPRIIKLSTFYPFSFILDFIWEPLNLNFLFCKGSKSLLW